MQQLSERLNDIHDKTKLRSDIKERAINQLSDIDIEILHSHMDRQAVLELQAVLYIWCKSQMGYDRIRKLSESKSIVDVTGNLTKNISPTIEPTRSRMIDVDIDQFKKTIGKL